MDTRALLEAVQNGEMSVDDALLRLKTKPFQDIGYAKVDLHRELRQGTAEVIFCAGKTPDQICGILETMLKNGQSTVLLTRLEAESAESVGNRFRMTYDPVSKCGRIGTVAKPNGIGTVLVASGGTSDLPVAEEAAFTAETLGNGVVRLYDVGVAGLHRVLSYLDEIMNASVIIAVAGMEGALASVIAGLADCSVIAVPTSVGYGASFGGVAALLSMLNSCAGGVSVVNIDNGFGAGELAHRINHIKQKN